MKTCSSCGNHELTPGCPRCDTLRNHVIPVAPLQVPRLVMANHDPLAREKRLVWKAEVKKRIADNWAAKYAEGQAEHKGDLGSVGVVSLLDEMENEALDQLSYVYELRRRLGVGTIEALSAGVAGILTQKGDGQ